MLFEKEFKNIELYRLKELLKQFKLYGNHTRIINYILFKIFIINRMKLRLFQFCLKDMQKCEINNYYLKDRRLEGFC